MGEEWSVASYEDAVARVITDTATGEKRQTPDAEAVPYAENDPQGRLSLKTTAKHVLLVAVYEQGKMFAYMHYDTGENLPTTYLTMQFRTWKTEPYTDSGWSVGMVTAETTFVHRARPAERGERSGIGCRGSQGLRLLCQRRVGRQLVRGGPRHDHNQHRVG